MSSDRVNAIVVGVLFITATVTSIIGILLYGPVIGGADYLVQGAANRNQVVLGVLFELILACAAVGTAVMLFPYLRRVNESIAIGYVCFRFLEVVFIVIGVICVLSLLALSKEFVNAADPSSASFEIIGTLLTTTHSWAFMLGPNFMLGLNTFLCSYLLYKSNLVPRFIAIMGLVGAVLIFVAAHLEMFGVFPRVSFLGILFALPVFTYEMVLAVWLIAKGFNLPALQAQRT